MSRDVKHGDKRTMDALVLIQQHDETARAKTLCEAAGAVLRDRNAAYGGPEKNFEDIAALWTAYMAARGLLVDGCDILPYDVANMCAMIKIARTVTSPQKGDHWADMAGYAACGAEAAGATFDVSPSASSCDNGGQRALIPAS